MEDVFVHVCLDTLVIHQTAGLNVWSTRNVDKILPVLIRSVNHHVDLAFVASMLSAMFSTIMLFALVYLAIKELLMHSSDAISVSSNLRYF